MRRIPGILAACLSLATVSACRRAPILLGVCLDLSGPSAEVAVNIRDAVILATEDVNAAGGIGGRPLRLVIEDDHGRAEEAARADLELVEAGAVAVIGHYTSAITAAGLRALEGSGVVLMSPTSSSPEFSGKDDHFFRTMPDANLLGGFFGEYLAGLGIRRLDILYDARNEPFSRGLGDATGQGLGAGEGAWRLIAWDKAGQSPAEALAALPHEASTLMVIADPLDTAAFAQAAEGSGVRVLGSTWAVADLLLSKGGRALEGMLLPSPYDPDHRDPRMEGFSRRFSARYLREPSLGISHGYEALSVLAEALRRNGGRREGLAGAIRAIGSFQGIDEDLSFDACGDVVRKVYVVRVTEGRFVCVAQSRPVGTR